MNLSPRQAEIAELLLITGSDRHVVCDRLGIADHTLRAHLSDMREKAGVKTDAELTAALRAVNRNPVPAMLARCKAEPRQWWMC